MRRTAHPNPPPRGGRALRAAWRQGAAASAPSRLVGEVPPQAAVGGELGWPPRRGPRHFASVC